MFCPKCGSVMKNIMHFEEDKQYQFNECPRCLKRTKNKRIHFDDVLKEETPKVNYKNSQSRLNNTKGADCEKKDKRIKSSVI